LDFINGKPKKAVEHLVSVIMQATLKSLTESKLEMVGTQEGLPRVRYVFGGDGFHT
jgi:hypothetical protein